MLNYTFLSAPTPVQIKQITELYHLAAWWPATENDPDHIRQLILGSHCFLIAVIGDEMVGMGRSISDRISDAYIQDVVVKPTHRGMGVATQIVKRLADRLKADGITWIGVIAESGTYELYQRLGFNPMPNSMPMVITI